MAYKRWRAQLPNGRVEYNKNYSANNRERLTKNKNEKYKNNVQFKLKEVLRTRLAKAVVRNQKTGSAVDDLGCSIKEFKIYIESKFQPGMTWDNYGLWHIDHINPLDKYDLSNREELLKACHYTNLQPLWAIDNIKKRNN